MKTIANLILMFTLCVATATAEEDRNLFRFKKAFPEAKDVQVPDGAMFRRYSIPTNLSLEDFRKRLEKAFGEKIQLLSADDPNVNPAAADFKGFSVAKILISGDAHLGLITREKESDATYTVGIMMNINVEKDSDSSEQKPRGRDTDIDMKLPSTK